MRRLAESIARHLEKRQVISPSPNEREIYVYGFDITIYTLVSTVGLIVVASNAIWAQNCLLGIAFPKPLRDRMSSHAAARPLGAFDVEHGNANAAKRARGKQKKRLAAAMGRQRFIWWVRHTIGWRIYKMDILMSAVALGDKFPADPVFVVWV